MGEYYCHKADEKTKEILDSRCINCLKGCYYDCPDCKLAADCSGCSVPVTDLKMKSAVKTVLVPSIKEVKRL